MSDNTAIKAFIKAQTEMGKALKDSTNPHFKSSYADLSSVMAAALPALNDNDFGLQQVDGKDEHGIWVETRFIHAGGEVFQTRVYLNIDKNNMQGYGSAQTYARRYGLMGLAGLAPEDDDGNQASKRKVAQPDEIKRAIADLEAAETIDDLVGKWSLLCTNFRHVAGEATVVKAKEKRKGGLQNADIGTDKIPY